MKLDDLTQDARVSVRRAGDPDPAGSGVVYWMQRAQRGEDNPALDVAVEAANVLRLPCVVFFAPIPFYPHANLRHYAFLAEGIADIAAALERRRIGFVLRRWPEHSLVRFCEEVRPALVVGDENPLREPRRWRDTAAERLRVPLWTVDADVVVPSKLLGKAQYAAVHMRRRLKLQLPNFLIEPPNPRCRVAWKKPDGLMALDPQIGMGLLEGWPLDRSVGPVNSFRGGASEGRRLLEEFVTRKLARYPAEHGKADRDGTSRLSPYLHFGHISPVRAAWMVQQASVPQEIKDDYLDQLLTWRELAIDFAWFNPTYDSFACAEPWAVRTLAEHARDERPALYTDAQLENAETADDLWNAAQRQMVDSGWMHNYIRMYWAKKILEWSRTPEEAYARAVRWNDKYFLDGRDPNGYAGIAWAIAGKFDRPWFERPVFGKIRYMSRASTGKKFDSAAYIRRWTGGPTTDALF